MEQGPHISATLDCNYGKPIVFVSYGTSRLNFPPMRDIYCEVDL